MKEGKKEFLKRMFLLSTMGYSMAFAIFIGLALGILLDRYFGTHPLFTTILLVVGIIAGFRNMYVLFVKYGLKKGKEDVSENVDVRPKIPDWAISMEKQKSKGKGKSAEKSLTSSDSNSHK